MLHRLLNTPVKGEDAVSFLFMCLTVIPFFSSVHLLRLASAFLGAVLLIFMLKDRYRPNVFALCCAAYILVFLYKAVPNLGGTSFFSLFIGMFDIIVFVLLIGWRFRDSESVFALMFGSVMTALTVCDAATVILFPNGLYHDSSGIANWILGSKNNRLYWYVIAIALMAWNHRDCGKARGLLDVAIFCFFEVSMLSSDSSTSLVALLFAIIGAVIFLLGGRICLPGCSYWVVLAAHAAGNFTLLAGSTGFLKSFVEGYLGKTMTFSDRTIIWERVIDLIGVNPWTGWGYYGNEAMSHLLGRIDFVNAHNQVLDSMFIGGIALLALFAFMQILIALGVMKSGDAQVRVLVCGCAAALLVQMLFEQTLTLSAPWIMFALLYSFCCSDSLARHRG